MSTEESILNRAVNAIRRFQLNPYPFLNGKSAEYTVPPSLKGENLHCYPGIDEGNPVLVIVSSAKDNESIADSDIQICTLTTHDDDIHITHNEGSHHSPFQISVATATQRIERWRNEQQQQNWLQFNEFYQCITFPAEPLSIDATYTIYLSLSGTEAQLAGDLIMLDQTNQQHYAYDTVNLVPPLGNSSLFDFHLLNQAIQPVPIVTSGQSIGAPAIVAFTPAVAPSLTINTHNTVIVAFEQNGNLNYNLSNTGGFSWLENELLIPDTKGALKNTAPALVHLMGATYCAFVYNDNNTLHLGVSKLLDGEVHDWNRLDNLTIELGESLASSVSLCAIGERLFCAYTAENNQTIQIMHANAVNENSKWEHLPTAKINGTNPDLCCINSMLCCSYTGVETDSNTLQFKGFNLQGEEVLDTNTITTTFLDAPVVEKSNPQICVRGNVVHCLFTFDVGDVLGVISSRDLGKTWSAMNVIGASRSNGSNVGLCVSNHKFCSTWVDDTSLMFCTSINGTTWPSYEGQ
jgi:hypothetical protein